ncbi:uncharacterized protein LOC132730274 isoform X2 [Ruditapes philippinarum]|uniref:uncharacterized protein LOC132730274 isoform X2 n=1 Tax=Ruditapes philippinarum TaxID=129788 RepID=UPI00295C0926|nr:uncharacterized protein LOC132730274 isoform X2 [Ruditapes philippinarum]
MKLLPSEIRYSQDSISNTFDIRSEHSGIKIGKTLDDLCKDKYDIPTISVAKVGKRWYTADNRRLWVFRKLEELGQCRKIPVDEVDDIPSSKMTTENRGRDIEVRGSPGGRWIKKLEDSSSSSDSSDDELYRRLRKWKI